MIDFIVFISTQFFKLFEWIDSIIVFANISLLKVLMICFLFFIGISFLSSSGGDKK